MQPVISIVLLMWHILHVLQQLDCLLFLVSLHVCLLAGVWVFSQQLFIVQTLFWVIVCVCVCVWERERDTDRQTETERKLAIMELWVDLCDFRLFHATTFSYMFCLMFLFIYYNMVTNSIGHVCLVSSYFPGFSDTQAPCHFILTSGMWKRTASVRSQLLIGQNIGQQS